MLVDLGLLIQRLVVGLLLAGHGAQKLFGWFGGGGLAGTAGWLGSMGLRPARWWAVVAGLAEFGGGLLLALGFLNPLGSLGILASMLMAIVKVHWPKVWVTEGGLEYPLANAAAVTAVALAGPGRCSLDAALGIRLPKPWTFLAGLAVIVAGLLVALQPAAAERREEHREEQEARPA
ncbi:MAG: DoxX family protein [Chloroflexi bacterium]|nr:DoxX family protein [Chloroflexota bacterium]